MNIENRIDLSLKIALTTGKNVYSFEDFYIYEGMPIRDFYRLIVESEKEVHDKFVLEYIEKIYNSLDFHNLSTMSAINNECFGDLCEEIEYEYKRFKGE